MNVPQVVIVGRPNVGKSSLFNWLSGRRLAIVDDQAGVTRDRFGYLVQHEDRFFELVDTGGIGNLDVDNLTDHIEQQIQIAIDSADVILFVVDLREGVMPLDEEVARRLRHVAAPVICMANKSDNDKLDLEVDVFYRLGQGDVLPISTRANRRRDEVLQQIVDRLGDPASEEDTSGEEPVMRVAIVGRRNVGKSTFVNTLTQSERMIVSEVPGTTRDSVDVRFELDGHPFIAIDTPGMRKMKGASDIEYYSTHRAQRGIRRADVVLLFFDCSQRIGKVDKQLADYIAANHKPCIFVVNKWDKLAGEMPTEQWAEYLRDTFGTMRYVPIAFVTGMTGKNVKTLINHGQMLFKQSRERVSTGKLNRLVKAAMELNPPPLYKHRPPKIYYATQVGTQPPTIVLFCNEPASISKPYQRYLLSVFRDQLSFGEVPIKLYLRRRADNDQRDEIGSFSPSKKTNRHEQLDDPAQTQ
ncbi:MAG: ribosome biogenesis GTPase Der [Planctomycetales bacterium]|nr:ribosome biogenesis GTPase Der [Planctomycetales bacterium]